jgi:hypothetical protein
VAHGDAARLSKSISKNGLFHVGRYCLLVTYRFDLVGEQIIQFSVSDWRKVQFWLLEFQPATSVSLIDSPPSRIRVMALGDPAEIAPALLAKVENLAGQALRVEMTD